VEGADSGIIETNATGWVTTEGELIVIYWIRGYHSVFMASHEAQDTVTTEFTAVHRDWDKLNKFCQFANAEHGFIESCDRV
jgi:hypothetical protein